MTCVGSNRTVIPRSQQASHRSFMWGRQRDLNDYKYILNINGVKT